MPHFVFSKVNLARCERCDTVMTEGHMKVIGYRDDRLRTTRWACKADKACERRQRKNAKEAA